jgi:hyperosmotically inducible periplasmic protein
MAAHSRSLAIGLQQRAAMRGLWPRLASLALAALLALAVGGVMTAHARTVGEFIDDARIAAEVMAKLTADSPSNFLKINVKSESGIVTLSGTVDSADKRARAAQIASAVNGVKGLVSNIQLAGGGAPTPPTANVPPSPIGTSAIDATGTITSVDSSTGTITLTDGRVLRAGDRTSVYQPTSVKALRPGDQVLVRGAIPVTVRAPETRMGTVARVDSARRQLVLTDGTVVRVSTSADVHRGPQRLVLTQIEPGAEIVVQLAPMSAASPSTTPPSPGPTQTTPVPTSPTPRTPSATTNVVDASDVSVVWTPSASASR